MVSMIQAQAYGLYESENERRLMTVTFAVSFIGHVLLFVILVFGPGQMPSRSYIPRVVNVSLVSLPSPQTGPSAGSPGKRAASPPPAVKSEPAAVKVAPQKAAPPAAEAKETVSLAPRQWKEKTSLKEKTFKPEKVVKSAIKRLEKTAEASKADPLATALERLREKVAKTEPAAKPSQPPGGTTGADQQGDGAEGTGTGTPGRGGTSGVLTSAIFVYQHEISYHIRNNWVFSDELAGARSDLETRLMVKIMANGEIRDVWFEKRSGNRYLDDSAYKAVMKSNPLPPLPKGYQHYNVVLGFTPKGLQ